MTDRPSLIIVPGMGEHTDASFKAEVVEAINYSFGLYPSWRGKAIEDFVDIVPCEYNSFFSKQRETMADAARPMAERLAALETAGFHPVTGELTKWGSELDKDNFFKTHWLDVLFYRYTMLSEPIRIKVSAITAQEVSSKGAENVHVLGHSLGTSVVHDSLASLYATGGGSGGKNLSTRSSKLGSVHLVANVSRLLQSFVRVSESVVHPCGASGCTFGYFQYRHILDPFTIPSPFDPIANGVWQDPFTLSDNQYQRLRPRLVTDLNTHGIGHYLKNPECHVPFLKSLGIGFKPKKTEIEKAFEEHQSTSLQGKAETLQRKWDELNLASMSSVEAFIKAAQALRDMLASFGQSFR